MLIEAESGGRDARTRTDERGAFDLTSPRESGRIVATRTREQPDAADPSETVEYETALILGTFAAAEDVDLGDVRFPEGLPLRGLVVDSDGAPLADADVGLKLADVYVRLVKKAE